MKQKILLTGIKGFIGHHCYNYLKDEYDIIGIDNCSGLAHDEREVPYTQTIDLLNNSLIEAESLENQLDLIVNQTQQLNAKTDRDLRFHDNLLSTDATESQASLNVTATDRANKSLKFDAQGSLSVTSVNVDDAEDYVLEAKSYATRGAFETDAKIG